jgi:hypothetical protein
VFRGGCRCRACDEVAFGPTLVHDRSPPVHAGGTLERGAARSARGHYVELRCELDCLVVLSACPQDIVQTNALAPTPLAIEWVTRDFGPAPA